MHKVPWWKLAKVPTRWGVNTTVTVERGPHAGEWTLESVDFGNQTVALSKRVEGAAPLEGKENNDE